MKEPEVGRVALFDTTLRDGEQSPGAAMTAPARLRIAEMLAEAGVDCIEAGFPAASAAVERSVAAIARRVRGVRVAALARCVDGDIDVARDALLGASAPRLHVFLATSDLHLEKKLRITRTDALERVRDGVARARRWCDDVEFSAEDASRSDRAFLAEVFSTAIAAGARTINVPDTVGYATPAEMQALIAYLRDNVTGCERATISVHTHDDLGLATANALAAVDAGARQVECTINGIGERAGNCALEEIAAALYVRPDRYAFTTGVRMQHLAALSRTVARATRMPVQKNKAIVGANAFAHESGIHQDGVLKDRRTYEILDARAVGARGSFSLSRISGRHAVIARANELGIALDDGTRPAFLAAVADVAQSRTVLSDADLIAVAARIREEAHATYAVR
ncbi:MAG: 2-isopropylmalate synthase [Candidatus Velthaea sp.]